MTCRGSQNHVWFTSECLGQGATGNVYLGRHKKSGEKRAVKCFNAESKNRSEEIQMREFDVMQRIKHTNIVKLHGIEKESQSGQKVIIMELCNGGSLYSIIEKPENGYGLAEEEFLAMFTDVTAGMKYLHDNNIIHRDLKPGNILRAIAANGRSVFKLTDFGAAKVLEGLPVDKPAEEHEFMSLYGTEEYLYPDMYARAVLRSAQHHSRGRFTAKVDLWSIGVTFYHAATGSLPFRPHGGRKNRVVMYEITKNKPTGAISGIQEEEGGHIEYSNQLPRTCRLSRGLQTLVIPVLAQLLETDAARHWSFQHFFEAVEDIGKRLPVTVFDSRNCEYMKAYLKPSDRLPKLKEEISIQSDIPPSQQLLFYSPVTLETALFNSTQDTISQYPVTSEAHPIVLVGSPGCPAPEPLGCEVPSYPKLETPGNFSTDAAFAKKVAALTCYLQRHVNHAVHCQNMLTQVFLLTWHLMLALPFENLRTREKAFRSSWGQQYGHLEKHVQAVKSKAQEQQEQWARVSALCSDVDEKKARVQSTLGQLGLTSLEADVKKNARLTHSFGCKEEANCIEQARILSENVLETCVQFKQDKKQQTLNYNEEQIHKYEKQRLRYTYTKMRSLLESHCFSNLARVHDTFNSQLRTGWHFLHQIEKAENTLETAFSLQAETLAAQQNLLSVTFTASPSVLLMQGPTAEPRSPTGADDEGFVSAAVGQLMAAGDTTRQMRMPAVQETSQTGSSAETNAEALGRSSRAGSANAGSRILGSQIVDRDSGTGSTGIQSADRIGAGSQNSVSAGIHHTDRNSVGSQIVIPRADFPENDQTARKYTHVVHQGGAGIEHMDSSCYADINNTRDTAALGRTGTNMTTSEQCHQGRFEHMRQSNSQPNTLARPPPEQSSRPPASYSAPMRGRTVPVYNNISSSNDSSQVELQYQLGSTFSHFQSNRTSSSSSSPTHRGPSPSTQTKMWNTNSSSRSSSSPPPRPHSPRNPPPMMATRESPLPSFYDSPLGSPAHSSATSSYAGTRFPQSAAPPREQFTLSQNLQINPNVLELLKFSQETRNEADEQFDEPDF